MNVKMFWRLTFKALYNRMRRVVVILTALVVGATIITAMSAVYFDIKIKIGMELRTYGGNYFITSQDGSDLDATLYQSIMQQDNAKIIVAGSPFLYGMVRSESEDVVIQGMLLSEQRKLMPFWQIDGSSIDVDFDERNVLLGINLAKKLELNLNDKIKLISEGKLQQFRIKGIIETGDINDNMVIMNLSLAQKILAKAGKVNNFLFSVLNQKELLKRLTTDLKVQYPELNIEVIRKISQAEGKILDKVKALMGFVSIIILILVALCTNTTLLAIIMERAKEIALQKALGAKDKDIIRQIFAECTIITVVALIVGYLCGYILAQILGKAVFNSLITMRWQIFPLTSLLIICISIFAVIIALRRALSLEPAIILKGE